MVHDDLKKILAGYGIAGLLTATFSTTGCSKPEEIVEKPVDQKISRQQAFSGEGEQGTSPPSLAGNESPPEKPMNQETTEVKIRGKSG